MILLLTIGLLGYAVADERLDVPNRDTEWDWDMLYDEYENEFWVCRGVQTQQLADDQLCSLYSKDDDRWPEQPVCWKEPAAYGCPYAKARREVTDSLTTSSPKRLSVILSSIAGTVSRTTSDINHKL